MKNHSYIRSILLMCSIFCMIFIVGCSSSGSKDSSKSSHEGETPRDNTPTVLVPEATGTTTYGADLISIDASNIAEGYVMLRYNGTNEKVKFVLKMPDGTECTYLVTERENYSVYPLSGGNGTYNASVLESISPADDTYSIAFTQDFDVTLNNEFLPFLYPNHYVNFSADSALVAKGTELASDCYSDLDVVTNIYDYVIKNVSYDTPKAKDLPYGYTPNPDETLDTGKGICFDYASLMSGMLRSQNIPTKLEVGYSGEVYHAWISCYVDEQGWVDNIIEFDGQSWSLMDPTLAASNDSSSVKDYIGDGSKYVVKYTY